MAKRIRGASRWTQVLGLMLIAFNLWRRSGSFFRHAFAGNVALMVAGFVLAGLQLTGFFVA